MSCKSNFVFFFSFFLIFFVCIGFFYCIGFLIYVFAWKNDKNIEKTIILKEEEEEEENEQEKESEKIEEIKEMSTNSNLLSLKSWILTLICLIFTM